MSNPGGFIGEALASCRLDGDTQDGSVYINVPGVPAPGGSKRHIGKGRMVDDAKRNRPWRDTVAWYAREQYWGEPMAGPLSVVVGFRVPMLKSHRRKDGTIKDNIGEPCRRPDLTKLWRAVEDALTGILWVDDAQIVHQTIGKAYALVPGVTVVVRQLPTGKGA